MIILDTSVLSRVFRRRRSGPDERRLQESFKRLLASETSLGLPGIVLQEALSGIRSEKQFADLHEKVLASFVIIVATTTDHVEAARLKNACLAKGLNLSGIDCLIAASAIAGDHELFAVDDDFTAIAQHSSLKLFHGWAVDPRVGPGD